MGGSSSQPLQSWQATPSHDQVVRHMACGMVLSDDGVMGDIRRRGLSRFYIQDRCGRSAVSAMSDRCRGVANICHVDSAWMVGTGDLMIEVE